MNGKPYRRITESPKGASECNHRTINSFIKNVHAHSMHTEVLLKFLYISNMIFTEAVPIFARKNNIVSFVK